MSKVIFRCLVVAVTKYSVGTNFVINSNIFVAQWRYHIIINKKPSVLYECTRFHSFRCILNVYIVFIKKKPWAYLVYILIVCTFIFVNNLERIIVLSFSVGIFVQQKTYRNCYFNTMVYLIINPVLHAYYIDWNSKTYSMNLKMRACF